MPSTASHLTHLNDVLTSGRSPKDFRRSRHIKRNVKLHQQIRDLITANPTCRYVGGNHAVEYIATRVGFEPHDLAIADVKIGRRLICLIVVPHRVWDHAFPSAMAIDLRHQARQAGYAAVLVPQAVVEREPRLGNSQLLARTVNIKIDTTSRMAVLAHLIENGASPLSELAGLVTHPDPFGAVLHLVTTGAIAIDLAKCITPYTLADVPSPASRAH